MEQAIPSTVKKALIVRVSPSINLPLGAWYAGHNPARRSSSTTMTLRLAGQPFWLNSNKGTKSLTGFFATFYARGTFGNSAAPKIGSCLVGQFWGLTQPVHPHLFRHQMITYLTSRGLSDAQIQLISGHESEKCLDIYQHLSLGTVEQAYQEAVQGVSI